ncbi:MAG: alpha-amylase family glycosyl hydrolase [bacterium]|nr:alpha-amylase family glycosyl hydrolase [bacterium]
MILEINTVNFIYKITKKYKKQINSIKDLFKISEIPEEEWEKVIYDNIIKYIWLMGIWQRSKTSKKIALKNVNEYRPLIENIKEEDILGSAYSITDYIPDPLIGDFSDLLKVKKILNKHKVGLILDFIPNHFGIDNNYLNNDIFMETDFEGYLRNPHLFHVDTNNSKVRYIAYGKDPFFPPWIDTLQINIFSSKAKKTLLKNLKKISKYADGVRVDMSMLLLKNIFYNNWKEYLKIENIEAEEEFWHIATSTVDLTFIAECYWNTENKLLNIGFDYTYDKRFLDAIHNIINNYNTQEVRYLISLDFNFQKRMVRFLENHDELRIANKIDQHNSSCILTLFFTCLGLKMVYWDQFEGQTVRIPVQILRSKDIYKPIPLYQKFLEIYKKIKTIIEEGEFILFKLNRVFDESFQNLIAYGYKQNNKILIVVINFSPFYSQGIINIKDTYPKNVLNIEEKEAILVELLKGERYYRNIENLHVILDPFQSQIFLYER